MNTKTETREQIMEGLSKPIKQPHVETFAECFEASAPWTTNPPFKPRTISGPCMTSESGEMLVGPYCMRRDGQSMAVRCADWVLSRIRENTIIVENDRMHFDIVDHGNGYSLVVVSHGLIIGSLYLAYIRTDSIPDYSEQERSATV